MNFIFLSPNFPKSYWNFCRGLKNNGVNVLGIGDAEYDSLSPELKNSLNEYYKVSSLENYDEVYRACAFFAFKYGKIDWIESNNEYWLLRDARLRTDFNVNTGLKNDKIAGIKYKSKMKEFYAMAGVKTARYHIVDNYENSLEFIREVSYPVIVKPNNGVGAAATYRLDSDEEFNFFYETYDKDIEYIMEEFINGELLSYDGIVNSKKEIVFETAHAYPTPIMDIVNEKKDVTYYSYRIIPEDLKEAGRKTVQTFDTNSRFFHCEFFRLLEDKPGLGNKGEIVGLEVNMRPPGGYTPDMMNFANNIDVYQVWANMICFDEGKFDVDSRPYHCIYVSRRDEHNYVNSKEYVLEKYKNNIVMIERMPDIFSAAMGNDMITARFETLEQCLEFENDYLKQY
ncbi:ATP-grasp domain-containing protein [Fusobacterium perfoetens]|uniref:ATP-grasp domain-containing protein n=1 Tax=Fusobacterium perfoetens TaxID=852 RepID=UPI00048939FB|nr:ATP-grasp domain-containing protein [Fusobacterium perfoetens]MCI6152029.1 ATP-grasp domain-containing protein [Fusobacterium perfoetens]MDY3238080.1 ATP-grasp domain-containing protein [Fusobacterium perfoetens]